MIRIAYLPQGVFTGRLEAPEDIYVEFAAHGLKAAAK